MKALDSVSLSQKLEEAIFSRPLGKQEVAALKARCEGYQRFQHNAWRESIFEGYSQYFGYLASLKMRSVFDELFDYGYLERFLKKPIRIFDFGAGTLGASLGALDSMAKNKIKVVELTAIDLDVSPARTMGRKFKDFLPSQIGFQSQLPSADELENSIVIASDVLNEMGLNPETESTRPQILEFENLIHSAPESCLFVFIEPATKAINQVFLNWRNSLLSKNSRLKVLLPCTHSLSCPALKQNEWCHEDRDFKAPQTFRNLVGRLGFRRGSLVFSLMVLGHRPSAFGAKDARVVSRNLKQKGKTELWLCAKGQRWKAQMLSRNRSDETEAFFSARRGHILDCSSTPPPADA